MKRAIVNAISTPAAKRTDISTVHDELIIEAATVEADTFGRSWKSRWSRRCAISSRRCRSRWKRRFAKHGTRNDSDHYSVKQSIRDAQYRPRDYDAWLKSLTPAERAKLKAVGLDEPLMAANGNGISDKDLADSPWPLKPRYSWEVDEYLARENTGKTGKTHEMPPENGESRSPGKNDPEPIWEIVRRLIANSWVHQNAKLRPRLPRPGQRACCVLGDSMTAIAKRHGVSRAAVSKIAAVEFTEKSTCLPPAPCAV